MCTLLGLGVRVGGCVHLDRVRSEGGGDVCTLLGLGVRVDGVCASW